MSHARRSVVVVSFALIGCVFAGPIRSAMGDDLTIVTDVEVQPLAMQAWREQRSFREIASAHPELTRHLSSTDIADAFDPAYHLRHVDTIFSRVGL